MLGCRFSFKTYAKNITIWFYWMLMDMCLPMFDIYQGGYKSL